MAVQRGLSGVLFGLQIDGQLNQFINLKTPSSVFEPFQA